MFALVAGGGSPATKTQAANAQLAFSPSSSSVAVGGNQAIDITVADVTNLGGYDVHLQFNPAKVHVASMTDSGLVKSGVNIVVCNTATIDNSAGTATDACSTISPFGTPVPGSGVSTGSATALLYVSFTGMALGTSSLTLTGSTIEDPNSALIVASLGTGSITVGAGVGGVAELTSVGTAASRTSGANASTPPYLLLMLAVGLLAAVAAGAGYVLRRRRRRWRIDNGLTNG